MDKFRTLNHHASPQYFRAIWISDVHLGTPGCKADYLLEFLKHTESDHLYLVGDMVDGWELKKGWYWPQTHNDVVQKILRKARKGTKVIYVPGNHDGFVRHFLDSHHDLPLGAIEVHDEAVHVTRDGRRLWITHGDLFDGVMQHARWLAHLGSSLYNVILALNNHYNWLRAKLGLNYWSLSQYLKHKVKNAVSFITQFEEVLINETQRRGYDGVVCGHIHKAEMRHIDGLLYCNDGDWVESLTALVETVEGELQLVQWQPLAAPQALTLPITKSPMAEPSSEEPEVVAEAEVI